MKTLNLCSILLAILTMIVLSGTMVCAEIHHVTDCTVCHYYGQSPSSEDCKNSSNLKGIKDTITTPSSGDMPVVFGATAGSNSYADGDSNYNGVCEVCHTGTAYHRNDASGDHTHYAGMDCIYCHKHSDEFTAGPGTYFSHSTHTDHLKGPHVACSECHNTNSYPDFADGATDLAATTACNNCHSAGGAYDGVAMAKTNWENGVYEADGTTLRPENKQWCATCHDNAPAFSKGPLIDPVVVVDNIDHGASFEGSWGTDSAASVVSTASWDYARGFYYDNYSAHARGYYGNNYHYHAVGSGTDTFTWTPNIITTAGTYNVWARWAMIGWTDNSRADDATYTIYHDGGSTSVTKNQRYNGGEWVLLGAYSFNGEAEEKVELVQSANGIVMADAIMFAAPDYIPEVLVDNTYKSGGAAVPDGNWNAGKTWYTPGYYGINYHERYPGTGSDTFTWTPNITTAGTYKVFARWTTAGGEPDTRGANDATYTIYHDEGSTSVTKDQQYNGGEWVLLGTYPFDGGGDEKVELVQSANGYVIADAIVWCSQDESPPPKPSIYAPNVIGDNATYGFYATGHGAQGLVECLDCHDAGKTHIDNERRTYASAHDNYQAGYRLAKSLVVPRPERVDVYAHLDDFALCADCHNLYEVLGENETDESHTNFSDDALPSRNEHKYHLRLGYRYVEDQGGGTDSDRDGRFDSTESCITCHNVHGSPTVGPMIRHGELISTQHTYVTIDMVPGLNFSYLPAGAELWDSTAGFIDPEANDQRLCGKKCHTWSKAYRVPYLGPKVLMGKAAPEAVPNDGVTDVLLTAFILDHNDDVPSVTIDLSSIGGGVETMYDDGLNGGDLIADDNIYSYNPTVPGTVASGFKSLQVTATDPDGEGKFYITLYVQAP